MLLDVKMLFVKIRSRRFKIDEIAEFDKDSEEIANQQDAPCDKLVRVSVSRTGVENQVMLNREVILSACYWCQ